MEQISGKWSISFLLGLIVSILLSGNIFFIKRLVDDLDQTKAMVSKLHESVSVINVKLEYRTQLLEEQLKKRGGA